MTAGQMELGRRGFLGLLTAGLGILAQARSVLALTAPDAGTFIQSVANTAMTQMTAANLSDDQRAQNFRDLMTNTFDLTEIGRMVLGRHWRLATVEQQQEFLTLFEEIQVYTWSKRFKDYSGETLDIARSIPDGDDNWLVESQIRRKAMDPINVAWRVHKAGEQFRILDIKVEGASMALTYRSEYGSVLQGNGGKIDSLLAAMRTKASQLRGL